MTKKTLSKAYIGIYYVFNLTNNIKAESCPLKIIDNLFLCFFFF